MKQKKIDRDFARSVLMLEMIGMDTMGNQSQKMQQQEEEIERIRLEKNRSMKSIQKNMSKHMEQKYAYQKSQSASEWKLFDV